MKGFASARPRLRIGGSIRNLLIALAWPLVVVAVFSAGVGIYFAASASWAVLARWWPPLAAGAAAVVALGAWWLWWRLPKREVDRLRHAIRDPKARTDVEDNFRKTMGQLLGGAAVLIGAGFAYLQFQQQQTSSRDLLISNQVAKGFELLGNKDDKIEQRLGGIYALEGVMNTSNEYYQPVLEALCAFVREETKTKTDTVAPASDIQAALRVIGRRSVININRYGLNDETTLGEAVKKASFRQVLLLVNMGKPNLQNAHIPKADLSGALLSGADLTGTDLSAADLLLADLTRANLTGTDLTKARLTGTDLSGANLSSSNLTRAEGLTQGQLDDACGDEKTKLDPPLTIKPCPPDQPDAGSSK